MKHDAEAAAKYAKSKAQTIRTESTAHTSTEPSHSDSLSQPSECERVSRRNANARLHTAPTKDAARDIDLKNDIGCVCQMRES